jgi:hypothetical protein
MRTPACAIFIVFLAMSCDSNGRSSGGSRVEATVVQSTTTIAPVRSDGFCELATAAAGGQVAFQDPVQAASLIEFEGLTERDRRLLRAAVGEAVAQLDLGAGYTNDLPVSAVNEMCGLHLTPSTLVE